MSEIFYTRMLLAHQFIPYFETTMKTIFGDIVKTEVRPTTVKSTDVKVIKGTFTLQLLKQTLVRLTSDFPTRRVIHWLSLPYEIYTLPKGLLALLHFAAKRYL